MITIVVAHLSFEASYLARTARLSISASRAGYLAPVFPVVGLPPLSRQAVPALPGLQRDGVRRLIGCRLDVAVEVGRGHSRR
jgi:hypothetical protein